MTTTTKAYHPTDSEFAAAVAALRNLRNRATSDQIRALLVRDLNRKILGVTVTVMCNRWLRRDPFIVGYFQI